MTRSDRSAGFVLIEVLVAFTIAATALGLLFRIHANATTTSILAEEYLYATELAQSLIAELDSTEKALAFSRSGTRGEKHRWTARGDLYPLAPAEGAEPPYRLRVLQVQVAWQSRAKERRVEVHTLKPFFE